MAGRRQRCAAALAVAFLASVGSARAQDFFDNGQPPRFGTIDRDQGLVSLSISSIQQDNRGFLWFGSQGGLNRYDGRELVNLLHDPFDPNSLANDLVQTLYYDEERDVLWVGTYDGMTEYRLLSQEFINYRHDESDPGSISNNVVIAVATDSEGDVWAGTSDGLNRLRSESSSFEYVETAHTTIRALKLDSSGRLWIGSYGGLQYWDAGAGRIVTPDVNLPSQFVMDIEEPEPGRLLLGLWGGGLVEYWPQTGKMRVHELPDDRIYTVLESDDGTMWAGSWGGGLWAKPLDGEPMWFSGSDGSELANSVVYSLFEDHAGLVWVGTNGGGVHYLSPRRRNYRVVHHESDDGRSIAAGKIEAVHGEQDGTLWLGIYSGGLNRVDPDGTVTIYRHDDDDSSSLSDDIVNCIRSAADGRLWVGTNSGLDLFDPATEHFAHWSTDIHPELPLSNSIVYWVEEDDSGRLWIATYGGGVDRYDPDTGEMVNFSRVPGDSSSLSDDTTYRVLNTSDGTIWVATNNGLNRFVSDSEGFVRYFHDYEDESTISADNIRDLEEDSNGRLWIGTYSGGLNRFDEHTGTFAHYTTRNGLASNNVLSILEGNDGNIWVATRAGINIIDPRTDGIRLLDERDGLFGVFFNYGHYKDAAGRLYFGAIHGLTGIDSAMTYRNPHPPEVHITSVSVFEEPLGNELSTFDGETFEFDHSENFLSFEFVALDYESPRHNVYAYMMRGFDKDWIYSGTRSYVSYTNLPAGTYTFMVRAANNDGVWSPGPVSITIHVSGPWYRAWWAVLIYLFLALAVLVLAWRVRAAQLLKRKNEELEHTNRLLERANADLERLSIRDSLTNLYNRRYFDASFEDEWNRARRAKLPLGLLMVDIDHFKQFNDSYGHTVGDRVLELVARALEQAVVRSTDFVARYGGEEFAVVLYETDREGALQVAGRIHEVVAKIEPPLETSDINYADRAVEPLRVSIGVHAGVPDDGERSESFVFKADEALYTAKNAGRNTTRVYEERDG